MQYGWSKVGQTRAVESHAHRERVNVFGVLRHDGELIWTAQQRSSSRDVAINFFNVIAAQPHHAPQIVILDNAAIHKGDVAAKKRRAWAKPGFHLYHLPPNSPELNRIDILWKHAKYFWRMFTGLKWKDLLDEVQWRMSGIGTAFT